MAKTCIALRHLAFEDLGVFAPVLAAAGYDVLYRDAGVDPIGDLVAPDLVVTLGGPIGVYQTDLYPFLDDEIAALRARLAAERPTLGICLGAQLIVAALGGRVYPGRGPEIGWAPVAASGPLAGLDGVPLLHWHGDTYDLPAGAVHLAATDRYAQQAFAVGDHVLAFQFHPEVGAAGFERWLIGHAGELAHAGIDPRALRRDAAAFGPAAQAAGQACLAAWLASHRPSVAHKPPIRKTSA
jgi:GMP synthase (glutamine-hydrolysing)